MIIKNLLGNLDGQITAFFDIKFISKLGNQGFNRIAVIVATVII